MANQDQLTSLFNQIQEKYKKYNFPFKLIQHQNYPGYDLCLGTGWYIRISEQKISELQDFLEQKSQEIGILIGMCADGYSTNCVVLSNEQWQKIYNN